MRQQIGLTDIVLKVLGLLLLTAAALKGHELLTVPVANKDLFSWRPFLIFQVEFELAMGIWLLSGLFKRLAWLATLSCFSLFCCVTLYKGLTGAASCGCFGRVHVNPWVTFSLIDLPAVIALFLFRPAGLPSQTRLLCPRSLRHRILAITRRFLKPSPSLPRFALTMGAGLVVLGMTTPILSFNKPAVATSRYEVLEPKTWIGKELPILEHIDIVDQLRKGTWLVLFYHYDCPNCQKVIPQYQQMARDLKGCEDLLRIAFVEMPPYSPEPRSPEPSCAVGRLMNVREWFLTTPSAVLLTKESVQAAWEESVPDLQTVVARVSHPGIGRGIPLSMSSFRSRVSRPQNDNEQRATVAVRTAVAPYDLESNRNQLRNMDGGGSWR